MFKVRLLDFINNRFVKDAVVKKFDLKMTRLYDSLVMKTDQGDVEVKFCDIWDGELIKFRDVLNKICKTIDHCNKEPWIHDHWSIDVYVSSVLGKHYYKVQFKIWNYKVLHEEWELFVNYDLPEEPAV